MGLLQLFQNKYPYTDFHELNLDALIQLVLKMNKELHDFIVINKIKYADPFEWDITHQYEMNTLTIDPETGIVYLSVQPVPSGVSIDNTDYWTPVFSLETFFDDIMDSISDNNEGSNTTASRDFGMGEWLWIENELYIATSDISAGTAYLEGGNIRRITVEDQQESIYYPNDKKLSIHAKISDYSEIVTSGDYHIYNPRRQAIEIRKVE